ncbi:hypothetical protein CPAR01_15084 [Colletotrichum paranaense]|uniref:Wings apart-like protein C-terminal domain-containing protein n=1 Tax=Colletotrichum paranaense TaxID=1914294 RepID=A0ABQ9RZY8_9PEZI|nr:uncharacterized protein CPAR01_15084 [Colletotrichum paranaense]KAK1520033.1 hypothetical protein CPAR01_15084 [Colletotrichum paranaense]
MSGQTGGPEMAKVTNKNRRRETRAETDGNRPLGHSGLPWTSSRCQRLLRPLQSRIALLRKVAIAERAACGQTQPENEALKDALDRETAKKPSLVVEAYFPKAKRQRPRRTYSMKLADSSEDDGSMASKSTIRPRSLRQRPKSCASGMPSVSTPILRKARHHITTSPSVDQPECHETGSSCMRFKTTRRGPLDNSTSKLMRLRGTLPPGRYQIYEGILHDLDTLLRSTILNHPAGGKKSLLSMCLNRVPQCAQEIENWEKSQAVNNGPVSSIKQMAYSLRVYDELQTLGATDNGWSHLRTLLRAHAIHILKGVIGEGLLDVSFIRILIDYCKAMQFLHETASLAEAMICFLYCKPLESRDTPRVNREGQLPAYLLNLAEDPVVESHLLETFSSLLVRRRLPFDMVTGRGFGGLWSIAACAVLEKRARPSATEFASTGLAILCMNAYPRRQRRSSALTTESKSAMLTLMSVLGALSAMAMISQDFGHAAPGSSASSRSRTQRAVVHILHQALRLVRSRVGSKEAAFPLLLALFLSLSPRAAHEATRLRLKAAIDGFGRGLSLGRAPSTGNNDSQLLDTTVDFTCSIAHCCGRATGQPSNSYFAKVCELIDTLETPGFARLRGNGAFVLAHKTNDLRDLVFAETLKKDLAEKDGMVVAKGNFTGFRWEEGISEWIAISPLARRQGDFTREALPRRRSGGRISDVRVLADRSELNSTTEGADKTGALVFASPRPTGESNGDQVGRRLAGKRKRTQNEDHGSRKRNSGAEIAGIDGVDGIDELGMGPENWPRVLGKSRLGSHVVGARMRDGCRRVIRSSETCSRRVLADLGEQAALNDCGLNDEDELGF